MLDAGRLRHRVTLQSRTTTADGYGQPLNEWADVATVYAEVVGLSGGEQVIGGAVTAVPTFKVTIRHYPGLAEDWRVIFKSRVFEITDVENTEELDVVQVLTCREVL